MKKGLTNIWGNWDIYGFLACTGTTLFTRYAFFWQLTQHRFIIPYQRFGTAFPETSRWDYDFTLRKIPEECRTHLHRAGSLKARIFIYFTLRYSTLI